MIVGSDRIHVATGTAKCLSHVLATQMIFSALFFGYLFLAGCAPAQGDARSSPTAGTARLLSKSEFAKLYADRVRAAIPGTKAVMVGELTVKVTGEGLDAVSHLDNAYAVYLRDPSAVNDLFDRRILTLREIAARSDNIDVQNVIACVRSTNFGVDIGKSKSIPRKRIVGDLFQYLCLDSKASIMILDVQAVNRLQRDRKNLENIAIRNVLRLSGPVRFQSGEEIILVTSGGDYEASLILVREVWKDLSDYLGSDMVFAVPNRDILVVARASSEKAVEVLKSSARRSFSNGSYPVSRKIYRWKNGRMSVLEH